MKMTVQASLTAQGPLVLAWQEGTALTDHPGHTHISTPRWALLEAAVSAQDFKPKANKVLTVHTHEGPLVVVGRSTTPDKPAWGAWGAKVYEVLESLSLPSAHVWVGDTTVCSAWTIIEGANLRAYRFDHYKTKDKKEPKLQGMVWVHPEAQELASYENLWEARRAGVHLTRDVVSEPPNVIYPASMADRAIKELKPLGVDVQILTPKEMSNLGMGALLGVAQGSHFDARMIVLRWNKAPDKPLTAIVGKGVTFDSGGISIKPSNNMEDMKYDMAGSGVVLGLFKTLAMRQAEANVVGIMAMVENMPSGTAQRPADVVTSMSGQTIEVVNTDAEGRLILADALWYVQEKFKPETIIDLATLTGAVTVALGYEFAGLFSNCDKLADTLTRMGNCVGEPVWRLPLGESFDRDINSDIADMKNVGSGRGAGSSTAAQFLKRFIQKDVTWAHLDIAGMAWDKKSKPLSGKGATGFGVRLLDAYFRDIAKTHACQDTSNEGTKGTSCSRT